MEGECKEPAFNSPCPPFLFGTSRDLLSEVAPGQVLGCKDERQVRLRREDAACDDGLKPGTSTALTLSKTVPLGNLSAIFENFSFCQCKCYQNEQEQKAIVTTEKVRTKGEERQDKVGLLSDCLVHSESHEVLLMVSKSGQIFRGKAALPSATHKGEPE